MKKTFILIAWIQIVGFAIFAIGSLIAVVELIRYGFAVFYVITAVAFFIAAVVMMLVGIDELD